MRRFEENFWIPLFLCRLKYRCEDVVWEICMFDYYSYVYRKLEDGMWACWAFIAKHVVHGMKPWTHRPRFWDSTATAPSPWNGQWIRWSTWKNWLIIHRLQRIFAICSFFCMGTRSGFSHVILVLGMGPLNIYMVWVCWILAMIIFHVDFLSDSFTYHVNPRHPLPCCFARLIVMNHWHAAAYIMWEIAGDMTAAKWVFMVYFLCFLLLKLIPPTTTYKERSRGSFKKPGVEEQKVPL